MSRRAGWMLALALLVTAVVGGASWAVGGGRSAGHSGATGLAAGLTTGVTTRPGATPATPPAPRATATPGTRTRLAPSTRSAAPSLPPPSTRAAQDEPAAGPILVVPGYGGQTALLQPLVRALRSDGRHVHVVNGLGDATQSFERQARTLGRQVDDLLAAGVPSVDVVGFSAGGVVARIWAEDGGSVHARRVVTLGSPHHGTEVAGLAAVFVPGDCPAACRQLQPGSTLLRSLTDGAPGPNWVSIRTRSDQISTPPSTAILPGAVNVAVQDVCPGVQVQHGMLPRTDFVVDLVVEALDDQDPLVSAPTTVRSGCPARS